ncbi:MAG: KpsF/GutQ family sugar-phosphate isomerase [Deltaproteobacteria bacterium]|jgi:arabinose-5-phosphate isomerase|nr:KpsF/GutQ family sugar-phosphate isomerase [Deltaproteobacteria bacterium]
MKKNHIPVAEEVILTEARALALLAEKLDDSFNEAVELISRSRGRVAVTGMGKSGHIARKVAATLSSTGTPAFFIHPSEAGHGDLGMLEQGKDVLLAYSNSGDTPELAVILQFCARFRIPVIGVTSNGSGLLGKHSDIVFALPAISEACPLGCAPTTSTTMMLALGDALALCLLSARGFTLEDFRKYHPGGKLGTRLLLVKDLMRSGDDMPLASPDAPMSEVLVIMTGKRLGCLGIVENEKLRGIITDGDLRRHMGPGLLSSPTRDVMTPNPVSFAPETLAAKALADMQAKGITNAFAISPDGRPVGVVHIHDFLQAGVM